MTSSSALAVGKFQKLIGSWPRFLFEGAVEERQADVHAVVDVGVVVVELLVFVADAGAGEARGEDAAAVMDVELVAPAAIDVDAAQGLEVGAVALHEVAGVMPAPVRPAAGRLAAFEVERHAEAERRARIGVV